MLDAARLRGDQATVNSISLSARTGSVRRMRHKLATTGPYATRFAAYDHAAIAALQEKQSPPPCVWLEAQQGRSRFEAMFNEQLP